MRRINDISANRYAITLLIAWMGTLLPVLSQEGMPFFRNYTAQEYQAHNRNFDVVCDSSGIAYFANFEGIIYYNGAKWNRIFTPGISRITRLHIDHHNQIWAGGHNYIGKIETSTKGAPILKSYISDQEAGSHDTRIGEVVRIEEKSDSLLFFTQNYRITAWKDSIIAIRPFKGDTDNETLEKQIPLSDQLIVATDGTNGLRLTNNKGEHLFTMTEANGLCSNTINQIASDRKGSLWAATDNGVFKINLPSFYSRFTANEGLKGEVTALYRYGERFYAGTLHGLFLYDNSHAQFKQLPLIAQSCWQLKESPAGDLYAVTSNGLFLVKGERLIPVNDYNTFSLAFDPSNPQTLYTGEIDGVYRIAGQVKEKIADIEKVMKLGFANNRLWAETLYGELYQFGPNFSSPALQGSKQGLKAAGGNKLYIINGNVNVSSLYGFQRWDPALRRFEASLNSLDSLLATGWWPGLYASTSSGQQEWITGGDGKNPVPLANGQIDMRKKQMLHPIKDYIIRTLYLEDNGIAWIGGDFGLIKYDPNEPDASFRQKPDIHIRSIRLGNDSIYFDGSNSDIRQATTLPAPRFSSSMKNFEFSFSSEANDAISAIRYSYYLQGYENSWSPWLNISRREYTNLTYGTYTFHVKAMDAFGRESEESSFTFTILKPYYLKWYSLLGYLVALVLLILLFFKWRTRKLLQEKMRLEHIVEQRTQQIREQRDEIAEKSQKLEVTLKELNEAQDQLIRQEKVATVGKLTQGLIDRILNPLNYIINFSHLSTVLLKDMKEDIEDEEDNVSKDNYEDMREILDMLNTHLTKIEEHGNSTSRILKAMEEMLSDHNCHFTPTDIGKLIQSNLSILKEYYQKEIQESDIRIIFEPLSEPLEIGADQLQLGRALLSMMQNCIYALHKKKDKIAFQAEMMIRLEQQGDHVLIHLRDNGIGIERSIQDKIFDPFFTTKTTSEAAGVGLYLSREIILTHNGTVEVESVKDEYTEFILSIPIYQSFKSDENE